MTEPAVVVPPYAHIHNGEVSILLRTSSRKPEFVHWGAYLGEQLPDPAQIEGAVPQSSFNAPVPQHLVPEAAAGWLATPGLRIGREGNELHASFAIRDIVVDEHATAVLRQHDDRNEIDLATEIHIEDTGLARLRHTLTNTSTRHLAVHHLFATLPLPDRAKEILDSTGRWCREVQPQRRTIGFGKWSRPTHHGRTGHDAPLVFAAGTEGFGFRNGEIWNIHLAWSGNSEHYIEKLPSGAFVIGAGEVLEQGDVVLEEGGSYTSPWLFASYSRMGLDANAAQFHRWDRSNRTAVTPRPVTLNSWEAIYFDHDLDALIDLAAAGSRMGVERFVLDDGWYKGRRNDRAGLGDWSVDPIVWAGGLAPLIDRVHDLGMQFGLWVEPEMISPDSDAARAHPEWISRLGEDLPLPWRHQQLLDLTNEKAWRYVYDQLHRLLADHRIDYLKWDYNRDSNEIGRGGIPRSHAQVLAAYRLIDAIREAHPTVEIENCSSGGGRVDLGLGSRTDRVWISDTNDPVERHPIQRWASQLLPPERIGSHVGGPRSHTTGRVTDLSFRISASWMQHMGIEWDIRGMSADEEAVLSGAIRLHKASRSLLHSGVLIRDDGPDANHLFHGIVSAEKDRAIYQYVALQLATSDGPTPLRLAGLRDEWWYRVRMLLDDVQQRAEQAPPSWMVEGIIASGRFLTTVGLHMPLLNPQSAITFEAVHVGEGP
ncbi:alpha-galactosidase [Herbiconiux ginsengi]|uniref:Alpha-galactosidase n=1 Tax=Herbiconiux ginsengi TaxID=381665 RepID=A0A1H3LH05_9MICO|nr:alpha-galactosidase [Herbiconiux ginsengi]SDY63681.1 alpha-galactosidase [Herbiconiux ginsengi]